MGTRGLIGYIREGKFSGTYNHYDSYPDGLGTDVIREIKKIQDWNLFRNNFDKINFVSPNYIPTGKEILENEKWANLNVSNQNLKDIYCLLRELQGSNQIQAINSGEVTLLILNEDFGEYAYILDLDNEILKFYEYTDLISEFPFKNLPESGSFLYGELKEDGNNVEED